MAVISALAALVIVPSTMAASTNESTDITADVESGDFYITASGAFDSGITLNAVPRAAIDQVTTATQDFAGGDLFRVVDFVADNGAEVKVSLETDFEVSASAEVSGAANIPGSNFRMYADVSGDAVNGCSRLASNSCLLVAANTDSDVTATNFVFGDSLTATPYFMTAVTGSDDKTYLTTYTNKPYEVKFGMNDVELTIPSGAVNGSYSSTLYILLVPRPV